uniref:Uncharacterized protein n=1 Tax=Lactuca sativa TaxID=4236 RepID=A0A9R1X458_LACSA|nr:hypothetical protein LSAT_V11C700349430 [Lactuca sativa]
MSAKKVKQNPFKSKKTNEVILEEITEEEFHEGYTIASALNFKLLGLFASISDNGNDHFGDVTDLSPLADMLNHLIMYDVDSSELNPGRYSWFDKTKFQWILLQILLSHMLKISNGYVYDVERLDEEVQLLNL